MCGRFYVEDETAREIEKSIRNVDIRIQKMRSGDIYPSQTAGILARESPELHLEEMHWGFPQYKKKGLLINARAETALERKTFHNSVLSMWQLLMALKECGLKNDALLDTFYD